MTVKQEQLITMHSWDFSEKVVKSKGWLSVDFSFTKYPLVGVRVLHPITSDDAVRFFREFRYDLMYQCWIFIPKHTKMIEQYFNQQNC